MTFWRPRKPVELPKPDPSAQRELARLTFMQHEYNSIRAELVARWFLWDLEKKINAQLRAPEAVAGESDLPPADVLHWESWVRGRNRWKRNLHSRPAYHLATGLLCGTGLGTMVLSVVLSVTSPMSGGLRLLVIGGAVGFVLLCGYALVSFRRNPLFRNNGRAIT